MVEVIQSVLRYTVALSPRTGSGSTLLLSRGGDQVFWTPLPCHQPAMLLLIPTRSACVTTYDTTQPPLHRPPLNLFTLAHTAEILENRYGILL